MPVVTDYCAPEDLGRFGVSAEALEDIPIENQQEAITATSSLMDTYLRERFTLPLLVAGRDLARCCAIISVYDLISGRGYNPSNPGDDNLRLRYEDQIKWLEKIAAGTVIPDVTDSTPGAVEGVPAGRASITSNITRGWQAEPGATRGPFQGGR